MSFDGGRFARVRDGKVVSVTGPTLDWYGTVLSAGDWDDTAIHMLGSPSVLWEEYPLHGSRTLVNCPISDVSLSHLPPSVTHIVMEYPLEHHPYRLKLILERTRKAVARHFSIVAFTED
ncbi:MAG TPA: hypothetical protein VGO93_12755 [Candidatus Xenobia bacterium]|jgi:hypothetical protein